MVQLGGQVAEMDGLEEGGSTKKEATRKDAGRADEEDSGHAGEEDSSKKEVRMEENAEGCAKTGAMKGIAQARVRVGESETESGSLGGWAQKRWLRPRGKRVWARRAPLSQWSWQAKVLTGAEAATAGKRVQHRATGGRKGR